MLKAWEAAGSHVMVCTHTARGANNLKLVANAKQATTIHYALGAYLDEKNETGQGFKKGKNSITVLSC